ncbi:MAG: hypothetical protein FJ291_31730 [Planctomycetes bacterium]|nr:hypothetical protein [Planctomycetota bacterium]
MPPTAHAMSCPRCEGAELRPAMTRQGVEVDFCPGCGGVWLDKGELFHFTRKHKALAAMMQEAARRGRVGKLLSPKTGQPMLKLLLFGGRLTVDYCRDTGGLWLDKGELQDIAARDDIEMSLTLGPEAAAEPAEAAPMTPGRLAAIAAAARPLPNLAIRSGGVLIVLYALLGALLIALVEFADLSPEAAVWAGVIIVALQFLLGPFLMDLSLGWFYQCEWINPRALPGHLRDFVQELSAKRGIRFPRFGVINDGAPNAFTYGHTPNNARVVLTRGMFELLGEREVEAVVAHEIGHAVHWDMLVMTMAYLVPLVAYYVYRTLIRVRVRGRDRSAAARLAIALSAYLVYIISEYLVLWLSRTREYWADRFSGEATGDPNALASALVKIGYGLAGRERPEAPRRTEEAPERKPSLEAVGALGIFDPSSARSLAIASARGSVGGGSVPVGGGSVPVGGGSVPRDRWEKTRGTEAPPTAEAPAALDLDQLKGAMRWDLWNPWAKFYELNSTHPLIASRLDHLGRQAAGMGIEPYVVFDLKKPECYWDEFLVDLLVLFLPALLAAGVVGAAIALGQERLLPLALSALGLGMLIKTLFSYRGGAFPEASIAGLLKNVKVSAVRGIPCTVRGTVIGRGVPGLIWSEDFVIQDSTGIVFLDYRQPFRIFELLFAILRRQDLSGRPVAAVGWYRRAPVPYIELKAIATHHSTHRCHVYHYRLFVALLLAAAGIYLFSIM